MVRRIRRSVPIVAVLVSLVACVVPGPGRAADDETQTRRVSGFDHVRLEGAFKATVNAGRPRTRFSMTGSSDALARVTVEVRDGTLVVGTRDDEHIEGHFPSIEVDVPVLRGFKLTGAGAASIAGLTGSDVSIEVPGAGSVVASGRAAHETIVLDGVGKIDASAVNARDVDADNNGLGAIYVRGSGSMTLNVNGLGEIRYAGNPRHVDKNVNGLGRIEPS